MSIEEKFDVPFVAELALREKQIQQNYRPIIAVHKWFARRPGTLFRSLLLSEFVNGDLRDTFYQSHSLNDITIADPFMGGGTPILEANRIGCNVIGNDVNPMAHWIVNEEIRSIDLEAYEHAAMKMGQWIDRKIGRLYKTTCSHCANEASVKYFLWVKTAHCSHCDRVYDLFPGYLLARNVRHTHNVIVCKKCGSLNELHDLTTMRSCDRCGEQLSLAGTAAKSMSACSHCGAKSRYPSLKDGPPKHRMFAIEYNCRICSKTRQGRLFKEPSQDDFLLFEEANSKLADISPRFIPTDRIPTGDETNRLHRWGYRFYRELFNARQLLGLESICCGISMQNDVRIRHALYTNLSDLLRYQNMLCRYDSMALKSLDIFSVHGFPVGLIQCESNIIGNSEASGIAIGSGGWLNITAKYLKAKKYCVQPFEIRHVGPRKVIVPVPGERIGENTGAEAKRKSRDISLLCSSSMELKIDASSLDAVFTDPPYFGNIQYAELMDFCYTWLRKLVGSDQPNFVEASTRRGQELTGNLTMDRGIEHFTHGLSQVFQKMAAALKSGAPMAFTYHHNSLDAYAPVAVAILDSGLTCTATIPCPAEMGGSIHINGSGSSILDSVFVCRKLLTVTTDHEELLRDVVAKDVEQLGHAGVCATEGDIRCLAYGHMARISIRQLAGDWDRDQSPSVKLQHVLSKMLNFGDRRDVVSEIIASIDIASQSIPNPMARKGKMIVN